MSHPSIDELAHNHEHHDLPTAAYLLAIGQMLDDRLADLRDANRALAAATLLSARPDEAPRTHEAAVAEADVLLGTLPSLGITDAAVEEFSKGIGSAAWRMNLSAFCEVLGWTEDDYAAEKFRDFQELARLLGRFDAKTLTALLRAQGILS